MPDPGEYQYRATISPRGWTEIRAWPATTCEGAFIRNPANACWVELMEASVGDITWALPTPSPARRPGSCYHQIRHATCREPARKRPVQGPPARHPPLPQVRKVQL